MGKVQGEGDYESARRYNSRTKRYVESHGAAKKAEGPVDEGALRKARSKSRAGGQDARDARIMKGDRPRAR
jgi:hypothetical protein